MTYHFEISMDSVGQYMYSLKAGNGEVLLKSELYTTKAAVINSIGVTRKQIQGIDNYQLLTAKNGSYYFNLLASNKRILGTSILYTTERARQRAIDLLIFNVTETIVDSTLELAKPKLCGSVRTFLEGLESLKEDKDHVYFFRGHSDFSFKLEPQIYRNQGWIANEDILIKELILRCPTDFHSEQSTFQTLVKMQHYSLPTRLLDITLNPLIALYFAAQESKVRGKTGEVIILKIPKKEIKYYDSDTVSVISNLSRRPFTLSLPKSASKTAFNKHSEIQFLLHEIKSEKPYFQSLIEKRHLESVVCVKPKLDNPRIIKQEGAFLLFGINGQKSMPATIPDHFMASDPNSILINPSSKEIIRNQLKVLGITAGSIFPEIERVATYIKGIYEE